MNKITESQKKILEECDIAFNKIVEEFLKIKKKVDAIEVTRNIIDMKFYEHYKLIIEAMNETKIESIVNRILKNNPNINKDIGIEDLRLDGLEILKLIDHRFDYEKTIFFWLIFDCLNKIKFDNHKKEVHIVFSDLIKFVTLVCMIEKHRQGNKH